MELVRPRLELAPARWLTATDEGHGYVPPGIVSVVRAGWRLRNAVRSVPPTEPWVAANATELDAESVASFLDRHGVEAGWLRAQLEALATVPLDQLSLLQLVWWLARPGGLLAAVRDTRAYVGAEGTSTLVARLSDQLQDAIHLGCPVSAITVESDDRVVVTSDGQDFHASAVIVAVPVAVLSRIEFQPPLPRAHRQALQAVGFGAASKIVATTSAPAPRWRSVFGGCHIKSAWRIGDVLSGVAPHLDPSPPAGQDLIEELAAAFDLTTAALDAVEVIDWTGQPYVQGTYIAYRPGQLTAHGPALDHGIGPVWFASAERSTWPNSMEGAVESGQHAADLLHARVEHRG